MSCRFWVEEGRNFVKWNRSGRKRNKKPQSIICKQCTRCDRQTPSWQALKTGADVTSEMEAEGMHGEPFQLKQRSLAPCASANTSQPWCGKKAHTEARETRRLLLGCSRVAKLFMVCKSLYFKARKKREENAHKAGLVCWFCANITSVNINYGWNRVHFLRVRVASGCLGAGLGRVGFKASILCRVESVKRGEVCGLKVTCNFKIIAKMSRNFNPRLKVQVAGWYGLDNRVRVCGLCGFKLNPIPSLISMLHRCVIAKLCTPLE